MSFSELCRKLKLKTAKVNILDEIIEAELSPEDVDAVLMENFTKAEADAIKDYLKIS